ncbi:MAG: hypothetical protein ACLGIR_07280 [Actinomycetes bacterium]
MRAPFRPVLPSALALALALVAAGCGGQPDLPTDDGRTVARVNAAVAASAEQHRAVVRPVREALDAVAALDAAVVAMGDAGTVHEAQDAFSEEATSLDAAALPGLREQLAELAVTIDESRAVLASARDEVDPGWARRWLEAEDAVLEAVREDARTADAVVQILQRHAEVLDRVRQHVADAVTERSFYRDDEEAAAAFVVRLDPVRRQYDTATAELTTVVEAREEATAALAAAVAAADAVWQARPDDQPTR